MFKLHPLLLCPSFSLCTWFAVLSSPLMAQKTQEDQETKAHVTSLDSLLDGDKIFEITPEQADKDYARTAFMRWLSNDTHDRAIIKRQPYSNVEQVLTLVDKKISLEEVNLEFASGKLARVSFSLWNRGDSTENFTEKTFAARILEMTALFDAKFGVKGADQGLDRTSAAKFKRTQWITPKLAAQLEYSSSKEGGFKAEFIRLRLAAPPKQVAIGNNAAAGVTPTVSKADLAKNVQTDKASGETYIKGVPMVDQGMKGYCSVASCQRVFNYYGMPVDEHEMAQVAQTGAGGGTSSKKLAESLDAMEGRLKVRFKKLYDVETNREYQSMVADYNRVAKKHDKRQFSEWYNAQIEDMDPESLKESRSKGGDYLKFQRNVKEFVDKGVPLLWSLTLGLFPENGKPAMQNGGGHMRLIIGYNFKDATKPQIIFTDSWGAGHEKKTIDLADAFAATHGLILLEPQQLK
jgi:Peptidase_C39 like family